MTVGFHTIELCRLHYFKHGIVGLHPAIFNRNAFRNDTWPPFALATMQIVELRSENATLLTAIAPDVFDEAIRPAQLEAFIQCPRHVMVLAVDDEVVVGMASAVEYFHPDKPPQLWINEVGVTPSRRNEGVGRLLIQELIDIGKRRGCAFAWLGTERSNLPAQRCFAAVPDGDFPSEFLLYEWDITTDNPS